MKKRSLISIIFFFFLSASALAQLSPERINESIQKADKFLKSAQLPSGSIQDSSNSLFNVWETILVTDALMDYLPVSDTTIQRALNWLQLYENEDHLICHNEKCSSDYCIETSALYIELLARFMQKEDLTGRLRFIENLQTSDGSWSVGNPDVIYEMNFPSVTAFVLNLFDSLDYDFPRKQEAFQFLILKQSENGSWGQTWEYYNCPAYALWQCIPVLKKDSSLLLSWQKATNYILENQLNDGSWYYKDDQIKNHVSPQLQTALMVTSLKNATDSLSIKAYKRGIEYLLNCQLNDGSWYGGYFPIPNERYKKREYLFASALIFKLLVYEKKRALHD